MTSHNFEYFLWSSLHRHNFYQWGFCAIATKSLIPIRPWRHLWTTLCSFLRKSIVSSMLTQSNHSSPWFTGSSRRCRPILHHRLQHDHYRLSGLRHLHRPGHCSRARGNPRPDLLGSALVEVRDKFLRRTIQWIRKIQKYFYLFK